MSQKTKKQAETVFADSMDLIDGLHGALVDLAGRAGVKFDSLHDEEADDLPETQFVVGGDDAPERGGIALDSRLGLCLTLDQAESLMAELARAIREEDKEVEIQLDGRLMVKRSEARDILNVLERG